MKNQKITKDEILTLLNDENVDLSEDDFVDELIFILHDRQRMKVKVPWVKPEDIKVGKKYWYVKNINMQNPITELIVITHIRSGIAFYESTQSSEEQYFPLGCFISQRLEPFEYHTNFNEKYYELVSFSEKVKIIYDAIC